MKKIVHVLAVVILMASVTAAFAADKPKVQPAQAKGKVTCCVKGQCTQKATADQCSRAGGKVVKDCADCK